MIAAATTDKKTIIIGLTEADIAEMRTGLTKTKQGGQDWGFRSLVVFMGESNEAMLKLLSQHGTKRQDDPFPNAGMG